MRIFLSGDPATEYFSIDEYADSIISLATENSDKYLCLNVYENIDDMTRGSNAIGGSHLRMPCSHEAVCDAICRLASF